MDKKDLKFYVAPTSEAVELKLAQILCASPAEEDVKDDQFIDLDQ